MRRQLSGCYTRNPGKWGKLHLFARAESRTLCGVEVGDTGEVRFYPSRADTCQRCVRSIAVDDVLSFTILWLKPSKQSD